MTNVKIYINDKPIDFTEFELDRFGDKKPDNLNFKVVNSNVASGDHVLFVSDKVNLNNAKGIFPFQYVLRDESGNGMKTTESGTNMSFTTGFNGACGLLLRDTTRRPDDESNGTEIRFGGMNDLSTRENLDIMAWISIVGDSDVDVLKLKSDDISIRFSGGGFICKVGNVEKMINHDFTRDLARDFQWNCIRIKYDIINKKIYFFVNETRIDFDITTPTAEYFTPILGGNANRSDIRVEMLRIMSSISDDEWWNILRFPEPRNVGKFGGIINQIKREGEKVTCECDSYGSVIASVDAVDETYGGQLPHEIISDLLTKYTPLRLIVVESFAGHTDYFADKKLIGCIRELLTLGDLNFTTNAFQEVIIYQDRIVEWINPIIHGERSSIDTKKENRSQLLSDVILSADAGTGFVTREFVRQLSTSADFANELLEWNLNEEPARLSYIEVEYYRATTTSTPRYGYVNSSYVATATWNFGSFTGVINYPRSWRTTVSDLRDLDANNDDRTLVSWTFHQDYRYLGTTTTTTYVRIGANPIFVGLTGATISNRRVTLNGPQDNPPADYTDHITPLIKAANEAPDGTNRIYFTMVYSIERQVDSWKRRANIQRGESVIRKSFRDGSAQFLSAEAGERFLRAKILRSDLDAGVTVTMPSVWGGYLDGDLVSLSRNDLDINGKFLVKSLTYKWPENTTTMLCGRHLYTEYDHSLDVVTKLHAIQSKTDSVADPVTSDIFLEINLRNTHTPYIMQGDKAPLYLRTTLRNTHTPYIEEQTVNPVANRFINIKNAHTPSITIYTVNPASYETSVYFDGSAYESEALPPAPVNATYETTSFENAIIN